jgi:hypothetical protein
MKKEKRKKRKKGISYDIIEEREMIFNSAPQLRCNRN